MRRPPACTSAVRRGLITVVAIACGALVACGSGGPTDRTETGARSTTTDETVLGVTVTRADVESTPPAEPVPVDGATTTTAATVATARTTTTRAVRPTTTAAPVTTTTSRPLPRPNRVIGSYAGRDSTDHVRVELFSNGAVFDSRELGAGGSFDFSGLPDGAYRIVVTDTIDDDDPSDGNDTSSQVISTTTSFGLTDGDTAYASCAADTDCATDVQQG